MMVVVGVASFPFVFLVEFAFGLQKRYIEYKKTLKNKECIKQKLNEINESITNLDKYITDIINKRNNKVIKNQ